MVSLLAFLDAAGGTVTRLALGLFLVINGVFVALVVMRRDRALVDRWTKRLVVLDAALLLTAGGAPAVTWAAKTAVRSAALVLPDAPPMSEAQPAAEPLAQPAP